MPMPIEKVTAETLCPSVMGGTRRHYPQMRGEQAVTRPYMASYPTGLERRVLRSLCPSGGYLVPPNEPDGLIPTTTCPDCKELRATAEQPLIAAS